MLIPHSTGTTSTDSTLRLRPLVGYGAPDKIMNARSLALHVCIVCVCVGGGGGCRG